MAQTHRAYGVIVPLAQFAPITRGKCHLVSRRRSEGVE